MGQIHIIRAVLVARTDDGDLVPRLQRVFGPVICPVQRVRATEFRVPSLYDAALILGFENNCGMGIDELEFQYGSLHGVGVLFVVAPRKAVMRERRACDQEKTRSQGVKRDYQSIFHSGTFPTGGECLIALVACQYERRLAGLFLAADFQQQADMDNPLGAL